MTSIPVITFGELGLIHCLGTADIPVYSASEKENSTSTAHSRYSGKHLTFSPYDSADFIDELSNVGKVFNDKAVLMGHDDRALLAISQNRERLAENFLFRFPDRDMVEQLLDKLLFIRLCEKHDLPAPASMEVSEKEELTPVPNKLEAPYIIKPAYQHYWYDDNFEEIVGSYQKAYICQTMEELKSLYDKISLINPSVVVQEYVPGTDSQMYDVNLYVAEDGKIASYVIGQKMRVYPPQAGWGSYVKTVHNEELLSICKNIIDKLDLRGVLNIQFKKDGRTGEPKLIEIHVRTSLFDFLGATAGQNIPAKYYADLTGAELDGSLNYESEKSYLNLARDLRLFVRHRKDYGLSFADWIKTYAGVSVFDGMLMRDPKAMFYELRSALTRG